MDAVLVILGVVIVGVGFTAFFGAPYVPSRRRFVEKAFSELYPLSSSDVVVDIGSGDGRVLRAAANKGARAIGYELHPILVLMSRLGSLQKPLVKTVWRNAWRVQLPDDVTLVYIFSVSRDSKRMAKKLVAEATRLRRPLNVMTWGSGLEGLQPTKTLDAYRLYEVNPLQQK